MAAGTIENPIIALPFAEPARRGVTRVDGRVTTEVAGCRRPSAFLVPGAILKRASAQLTPERSGAPVRQLSSDSINETHASVARWQQQRYPHATSVTRDLRCLHPAAVTTQG